MFTISGFDVPEYVAAQDLADALEAWLPKASAGAEQLAQLRQQLELIGAATVGPDHEGPATLKAINSVGAELVKASLRWGKTKGLKVLDEERESYRLAATQEMANFLVDYDLPQYLNLLASIATTTNPVFIAKERLEACRDLLPIDLSEYQEAAALTKWDISITTKGEVAPPAALDFFDPLHLSIERKWTDSVNLTTTLSYAGHELACFQNKSLLHALGHRFPRVGDGTAMQTARTLFYQGDPEKGVAPLNGSSLSGMITQIENDLKFALNDDSLHSIEKHSLRSVYDRLTHFKEVGGQGLTDSSKAVQHFDEPGR